MSAGRPFSSVFVSALSAGAAARIASIPELEEALVTFVHAAELRWPEFSVSEDAFLAFVGQRLSDEDDDISVRLTRLDLYATCACFLGDARAMAAIETRYFPSLDAPLAKINLSSSQISDVKQGLLHLLFVRDGDSAPKIAEYTGRGELKAWLRVTAVRAALKVIRSAKKERLIDGDAILQTRASGNDPELLYMKEFYRAEFKEAFQEALDSLADREKNLLRQHLIDALSLEQLAALYGVHRATAARWLATARESLMEATRDNLMCRARINERECDSIIGLVRSQLDLSIRRRLKG